MRLMNKLIPILRYRKESGYYNEDEEWIDGVSQSKVFIRGDIQPYNEGHVKKELPNGVRAEDVITIRAKQPVVVQDDLLNTSSDELDYLGARYQCFSSNPWLHGLSTDHYHALFIRKDKL